MTKALAICCAAALVAALAPAAGSTENDARASGKTLKRKATEKIRNGRYVGTRGDGFYVDHLFCPGGKFEARTTSPSGGPTGVSEGTNWKVAEAKPKRNGFVATIRDSKEGFETLLRKRGEKWSMSVSFGTPDWGRVERSGAKAACADL